ncbi:hypothetical protein QCN29_03590 [Streptomyces sp. HNM0663]|uniref:Uncharacterized protein n=1 Tax=Streptomyces chengmaiensis TaxID=3040919 RepID=A0ABT6HGI9_9ACTN|nr:hypothetical protein [Streptomyces chengmaiensis]MDH2387884.1 hypothetical protein [Streptomyces chengmaiensis]
MSEGGQRAAPAAPAAPAAAPAAGGGSRGAEDSGAGEGRRPEGAASGEAGRSFSGVRSSVADSGAAYAAQQAGANFRVHGYNTVVDGQNAYVHAGDVHHHHGTGPRLSLVSGSVPREELRDLRLVFVEPTRYRRLQAELRRERLLVLCGDAGSGRAFTAVSLLDEAARGEVHRMDSATEIDRIAEEDIRPERGYLLEVSGDDDARQADQAGEGLAELVVRLARRPAGVHLDRLRDLLQRTSSFAVLVVDPGGFADELLRGRYARMFEPPDPQMVLRAHLLRELGQGRTGTVEQAMTLANTDAVQEALGLDVLRPHEAVTLSGLLARQVRGEIGEQELLAECGRFAEHQARSWFSGAGRGASPGATPNTLRIAAFRCALAAYNGSPYGLAAEAAERLAREFMTTATPEEEPGRPLFTDSQETQLSAARAVLEESEAELAGVRVKTTRVRFQGRALSLAVLLEVWSRHHDARGPLIRWLRAQCDDPRPAVWLPAAVTCGVLLRHDSAYVLHELLLPLSASLSDTPRRAAATAMAAAAEDPGTRLMLDSVLQLWAEGDDPELRRSTALAHGFGVIAPDTAACLSSLGRLARRDDWDLMGDVAYSVARLLAGDDPSTVVSRIGMWLADGRRSHNDLGLLSVIQIASLRTWAVWTLEERSSLEPYGDWPLLATLLATRPDQRTRLADLMRFALETSRSRSAAVDALTEWLRRGGRTAGTAGRTLRVHPPAGGPPGGIPATAPPGAAVDERPGRDSPDHHLAAPRRRTVRRLNPRPRRPSGARSPPVRSHRRTAAPRRAERTQQMNTPAQPPHGGQQPWGRLPQQPSAGEMTHLPAKTPEHGLSAGSPQDRPGAQPQDGAPRHGRRRPQSSSAPEGSTSMSAQAHPPYPQQHAWAANPPNQAAARPGFSPQSPHYQPPAVPMGPPPPRSRRERPHQQRPSQDMPGPFVREYKPRWPYQHSSAQVASALFHRYSRPRLVTADAVENFFRKWFTPAPYTVIDVQLGWHVTAFEMELPSADPALFFPARVKVRWRVVDPFKVAKSQITDVAQLMVPEMEDRLRSVSGPSECARPTRPTKR